MKKTLFRIVAILLILVLSSSSVISSTLAKYVTHGGAFTDEARVAKWGVDIKTSVESLFEKNYSSKKGDDTVITVSSTTEVVAPGTGKSVYIDTDITGKPEVAFEIRNNADVTLEFWEVKGEYYCPIIFTINGESAVGNDFNSAQAFEEWIESKISKVARQYPPGIDISAEEGLDIDISWEWPFEGDDEKDTILGNAKELATINITFSQTVVQIDSYKPYMRFADNTLTFGTYPQREVTDETLIAKLNENAGALPTSGVPQNWTSYGYYKSGASMDYMWYIDIEEGSNRYRGVYFTEYRPLYTSVSNPLEESLNQLKNGYYTGNVYWFKYEPISWTILSEDTTNGIALILCDMIIDSQPFQNDHETNKVNGKSETYNVSSGVPNGIYANNYAYSTVRAWLNDTFYDTAFNELQKQLIELVDVDNSSSVTSNANNPYACENTEDKIFFLSYVDAMNSKKGYLKSNEERYKKPTDYAQAQGTYVEREDNTCLGYGRWYLRTPNYLYSYYSHAIMPHGGFYSAYIYDIQNGIAPALWINLS